MSNYGYGRPNPYDQRSGEQPQYSQGGYDSYNAPSGGNYGRQQYNAPTIGRDEYSNQNVELQPLAPNAQQYGRQNGNPILAECEDIKTDTRDITETQLPELQSLQRAVLNDPDVSSNSSRSKDLEIKSAKIMTAYRGLAQRVKRLKSQPEAGSSMNRGPVGTTERLVQEAIRQYQQIGAQFDRNLKEQMARQYRIVRPEASEAEVRQAVEDTESQQVFSQALLQSDRRGQSRSALNAVQGRHEAIQKIEKQMTELVELFEDMANLVVQQEAAVTNIEMKGEEVVENMDKGTEQIGVAVKTARATRKKKWWCLGITLLIIIIIVVVVLLWQFVFGPNAKDNRNGATAKRWVLPSADVFALPAGKPCAKSAAKASTVDFISSLELVKKAKRFQA